jgi:hypothetical protein
MYNNIYTNNSDYGGTLEKQFSLDIKDSNEIFIASGYFGKSQLSSFKERFIKIGKKGTCKILFGMIYHKGVRQEQLDELNALDSCLRADNPENGIYISRKECHGKIYKLKLNQKDKVYVGSSNFSSYGFSKRDECTIQVNDENTITGISNYIDYLFKRDTTSPLSEVDLNRNRSATTFTKKGLKDFEIDGSEYPHAKDIIGTCRIKLRVDEQQASSLNLFFGKGRKNTDGLYSPRPWYEVEITSQKKDRNEYYPKSNPKHPGKKTKSGGDSKSREGGFIAYAEADGKYYQINMKVGADNGKDIYSSSESGGRSTLGQLIKGKLERKGVLKKNERITSDILHDYGKNFIELKKINDKEYIIEF